MVLTSQYSVISCNFLLKNIQFKFTTVRARAGVSVLILWSVRACSLVVQLWTGDPTMQTRDCTLWKELQLSFLSLSPSTLHFCNETADSNLTVTLNFCEGEDHVPGLICSWEDLLTLNINILQNTVSLWKRESYLRKQDCGVTGPSFEDWFLISQHQHKIEKISSVEEVDWSGSAVSYFRSHCCFDSAPSSLHAAAEAKARSAIKSAQIVLELEITCWNSQSASPAVFPFDSAHHVKNSSPFSFILLLLAREEIEIVWWRQPAIAAQSSRKQSWKIERTITSEMRWHRLPEVGALFAPDFPGCSSADIFLSITNYIVIKDY